MTGELVTEDGDPVDCPTRLEMPLQFFWGSAVINLYGKKTRKMCWSQPSRQSYGVIKTVERWTYVSNENTSSINGGFVVFGGCRAVCPVRGGRRFGGSLELTQLFCLAFHLCHPLLHQPDLLRLSNQAQGLGDSEDSAPNGKAYLSLILLSFQQIRLSVLWWGDSGSGFRHSVQSTKSLSSRAKSQRRRGKLRTTRPEGDRLQRVRFEVVLQHVT
jgi:hypothetical protein